MLGEADATPMIAVKDLDRARTFYEDTLGLRVKNEMSDEVLSMKSGDTLINVYRSEFAGTKGHRSHLPGRRSRKGSPRVEAEGRFL
jgi:catechol 2,3-dioxygenase-like lactoylglutathione lyase family enzyme